MQAKSGSFKIGYIAKLGFSLKEISQLLDLSGNAKGTCGTMRKKAEEKQTQVAEKIADLKRIQRALGEFVATCGKRSPSDQCPFLKRFYEES